MGKKKTEIGTVLLEDLKGMTQELQFVMRCEAKCWGAFACLNSFFYF